MRTFLKFSKNRDGTQTWEFQQGVIWCGPDTYGVHFAHRKSFWKNVIPKIRRFIRSWSESAEFQENENIFKYFKQTGTEHIHVDFSRESSDVVLTHMEYMLGIEKLFEKILFQKFGDFYFHDQNRLNCRKMRTFLKFSNNRDGTQTWGFQQGVIWCGPNTYRVHVGYRETLKKLYSKISAVSTFMNRLEFQKNENIFLNFQKNRDGTKTRGF